MGRHAFMQEEKARAEAYVPWVRVELSGAGATVRCLRCGGSTDVIYADLVYSGGSLRATAFPHRRCGGW